MREGTIDVMQCVTRLREQRPHMVQTVVCLSSLIIKMIHKLAIFRQFIELWVVGIQRDSGFTTTHKCTFLRLTYKVLGLTYVSLNFPVTELHCKVTWIKKLYKRPYQINHIMWFQDQYEFVYSVVSDGLRLGLTSFSCREFTVIYPTMVVSEPEPQGSYSISMQFEVCPS